MSTPVAERHNHGYRRVDHVATQDLTILFRVIATIAAAVLIVFGLVALVRIDWDNGGLDAAAVEVGGITFTPIVAIAAAVAGLFALLAAATRDRTSKLIVGALLLCGGIAAFIAQPDSDRVILEDAHGWLMVIIGGVLIVCALAMSFGETRRVVDTETTHA